MATCRILIPITMAAALAVAGCGGSADTKSTADPQTVDADRSAEKTEFNFVGQWSAVDLIDQADKDRRMSELGSDELKQAFQMAVNEIENTPVYTDVRADGTFTESEPVSGESIEGTWRIVEQNADSLQITFQVAATGESATRQFAIINNDRLERRSTAEEEADLGFGFTSVVKRVK